MRKSFGNDLQVIHGFDMDVATASSSSSSAPPAAASRPCCAWWPAWRPSATGEIAIGERVVNRIEPKDRDIAMVFQNYALYPHMNGRENMAYGLKIRGLPPAEIDTRVASARRKSSNSGLTRNASRASSPAGSASAWRWAAPSCANRRFSSSTSRLSNLDAKLRVQMRAELQALHRRLSTTSLYVTHDQVEAMTLAQRMIVMNAGRAEQIGAPLEVYEKPATTFVAGFIGSPPMNLIPTQRNGRDILLGVRPEHLEPCTGRSDDDGGGRSGRAARQRHPGLWPHRRACVRRRRRCRAPAPVIRRPHRQSAGALRTTHEHHFDAGTGLRIED
jgi:sn-glycerol 3-phosphate transport system ATP-binding protein